MESFQWSSHFETRLPHVDQQHRQLVDLINRFGSLITEGGSGDEEQVEAVFQELIAYARYHFSEEESMMAELAVDPRFTERHLKEHAHYLQEIERLHAKFGPGNRDAGRSLLKFLASWLAFHILGTDRVLAVQIKDIKAGASPEAAFAHAQKCKVSPTAALLNALNSLFEQVSERNRELSELNRTLEMRVTERTEALAQANRHLEMLAMTDVLTELPNRRHAIAYLSKLWDQARRNVSPLSCMIIDADGFKQINDTFGHDAGDAVLCRLASRLCDSVRTDDIVARLGGDEFLIICPDTPLQGALYVAECVRQDVAALQVPAGAGCWAGSVSIGVATNLPDLHGVDDLIKMADRGVYAAKRNGRNRVGCEQTQPAAEHLSA